ncbi:hypothetical protein EOL73_04330 [Candidatus Saccharibacteria bacterium]|nr:hypothetical protein [Candidatus Saccharibacteria bacterium]
MTTIGTVELIAKIDTSAYKKGAKEIEGANDDIEKSADDAAKKTGRAFDDAAKVATGAMVAAAALVTASWVNSASEIQSLRASFESLTGNVDSTNEVMTTLYDLGKKTAFSNKDIQAAGRSFLATGVEVGNLSTLLSQTADIAGATGADLGRLTMPLTQAIARGKLQTQDFYQILDAGAGALRQPLTELAGKKGFGSLADAMEKGAITSDDLLTVMGDVTKQGGFAFEGALKQSQTFAGQMSNLQEAVTNFGLGLLGVDAITGTIDPAGPFAKLSEAIGGATKFLSENGEMIKQVGTVIAIFLTPAIIALGIQGLIAGARLATGILLALGPIGLIIAAVAAAVALIIMNWDAVSKFFGDSWNTIVNIFSGVGKWFSDIFGAAWNGIVNIFSGVGRFFRGVWDTITGIFTNIGTAIGNAIGGAFKSIINTILKFAVGFINGFIDAINGAIDIINNIPGVKISTVGRLPVPQLADGGIITARPGGMLATIGEAGEDEAVIPLSKLDKLLANNGGSNTNNSNITINVSGTFATSKQEQRAVAEMIAQRLREVTNSKALSGGIA